MQSPPSWSKLPAELRRMLLETEKRRRLHENPLQWIQLGNGKVVPLRWMPKQVEAFARRLKESGEPRKVFGMFGGNQFGKTVWAGAVVAAAALGVPVETWPQLPADPREWRLGPAKEIWCVTISFEKSRDVQQKELWDRIPRHFWRSTWNEKTGFQYGKAKLTNGTTFTFKSAEQKLRTFEGSRIDLCWIDETIPRPYFEAILPRTVAKRGPIIWTTITDDEFLEDLFVRRELTPEMTDVIAADEIDFVAGTMHDNVHLSAAEVEMIGRTMDPVTRAIRIEGKFARRQGLVYPDFKEVLHCGLIEAPLTHDQWHNRWEIIDPGWAVPCAVVFGFIDGAGVRTQYDEFYRKHATIGEVAAEIYLKRWSWRGLMSPAEHAEFAELTRPPLEAVESAVEQVQRDLKLQRIIEAWRQKKGDCAPRKTLVDEYAKQRDQAKPVSFIQQLWQFGIRAEAASNMHKDLQRQAVRLLQRPANGLVRFRINAGNCRWTIWEFGHHKEKPVDEATGEHLGDKERVVEAHNHAISCWEYWEADNPRWRPPPATGPARGTVAAALLEERERPVGPASRRRG